MVMISTSCWECKFFLPDDVTASLSGRCCRFAPHSLDYFGFSSMSVIAHSEDDTESSTTSSSFVEKLALEFDAVLGTLYNIEFYFELYAITGEDVNAIVQVNGTNVIADAMFKAFTYAADKWNDGTGGFKLLDTLDGSTLIQILYKNQYGDGPQKIRRARLKVSGMASEAISSIEKYSKISDGTSMWCGEYRHNNKLVAPIP